MAWLRGEPLGHGSFATVYLAMPGRSSAQAPPLMAVKSSDLCNSASLKSEKRVLDQLSTCPQIIRCLGDDHSVENGEELYNVFLEYASSGSLADQVKNRGGSLPESDVRRYAQSILLGLREIHAKGFVHCDIKLQNILVFDNGAIKIADFGLAKKAQQKQSKEENRAEIRGTPLYMAPESVNNNEYEYPADIWALGCAVVEMVTGKPVWSFGSHVNICNLLLRIGVGEEVPQVPKELSFEGKDFLGKCFVKDPRKRWTAEMLLDHPFVAAHDDHDTVPLQDKDESTTPSSSPRSPFDFSEWVSVQSSVVASPVSSPDSGKLFDWEANLGFGSPASSRFCSPLDRLLQLVTDDAPNWSFSESWATVR
ncbi:mitogen-activated protein kinase kinase kinase 20-like [Alnus glutinosa]|uniref:mitogen-activated protein kinase kinase kinase 20-like n=1 Tax=Alnus glutinosa TaxID=3517 RepID=UPI002D780458|nr:mitogen-activated protein kinase kinase kinase 20-like [Alnus glutinosa]